MGPEFSWPTVMLLKIFPLRVSVHEWEYMMTGTESMSGPPEYGGRSDEPDFSMGANGDLLFASIVVFDEESGPRGRDLLIAEPSTEKECPRRLVRTDYRAS